MKFKGNLTGKLVGIIFFVIGGAFMLAITEVFSVSIFEIFKDIEKTIMFIGSIFFFIMAIVIPTFVLSAKEKTVILTVMMIRSNSITLKNEVVLHDESLPDKYFTYGSSNEKFIVGQRFKVNIYKYGSIFSPTSGVDGKDASSLNSFSDFDFEEIIR